MEESAAAQELTLGAIQDFANRNRALVRKIMEAQEDCYEALFGPAPTNQPPPAQPAGSSVLGVLCDTEVETLRTLERLAGVLEATRRRLIGTVACAAPLDNHLSQHRTGYGR